MRIFTVLILCLVFIKEDIKPSYAEPCCSCPATVATVSAREWIGGGIMSTVPRLVNHMTSELTAQRIWMVSVLWEDNILPALMLMSEQLSVVAIKQVQIFGTFMDAKHQMETQQVLQKLRVQAHKDYQPSVGLCEFGSQIKSLAASEHKAEFNAFLMSQRSQDRNLGQAFSSARTGQDSDKESRIKQFKEKYCDPEDNNSGLDYLCYHDSGTGALDAARMNKDIDFARTVAHPLTLDVDFTDENRTNEEEDILALAANLYGHDVFKRPPAQTLKSDSDRPNEISAIQSHYMDARSIVAKRSVAENSFNAITAMKSKGTPGSSDFLEAVLAELGISKVDPTRPNIFGVQVKAGPSDAEALIGEEPSYYAQMEILGKKIYQNPAFYTNLYDKPANVERKAVALQAIGLMQKFDLFKSYLRHEASLSVLLELSIMELQDDIENDIGRTRGEGQKAQE